MRIDNTAEIKKVKQKIINFDTKELKNTDQIGSITIPKINLKKPLYNLNSSKNNIEENVTILKESIMPNQNNSIIFIAAHSGNASISFFNNLNQLNINDEVIIEYLNKDYHYLIKDIWEEKKNGFINVNKEKQNQVILTTCSPNHDNYQLIINCIEKESN